MTEFEVDASVARELIRAQFPRWAELEVRPVPTGGWDNRTFRLGPDLALRFPSAVAYAAQVQKEQTWLPRLAPELPLPVPEPVAVGSPGSGYPWSWSVMRWIEGEDARTAEVSDRVRFARDLASFLRALRSLDTEGGPAAGDHCFWRGGSLDVYDEQTRKALDLLETTHDVRPARAIWTKARASRWDGDSVWVHGDVAPGNLLVKDGVLAGVLDFGCSAVGDPACDLAIAWTYFSGENRKAFALTSAQDAGTWARARGWALWKALITIAGIGGTDPSQVDFARRVLGEVLDDPIVE